MNYAEIKKLDEESARKMVEGTGPVDECICSLLAPSEGGKKSLTRSIKKVFATIKPGKMKKGMVDRWKAGAVDVGGGQVGMGGRGSGGGGFPHTAGGGFPHTAGGGFPRTAGGGFPRTAGGGFPRTVGGAGLEIPLVFTKGEQGIYTTKEVMKRKGPCGKCGCDKENIVMKHSYANIRITSPDVSSICPCPNTCLPEKTKLMNNIKVTVEHISIDPDSENSETSLHKHREHEMLKEPDMTDKRSVTSLINAQYDTDEDKLYD